MEKLKEIYISGTTEYAGNIIAVTKAIVRLPDESVGFREIAHVRDAVCIVALKGDKVMMVHQFRFAVGEELLELPAGRIDEGETPDQAAQRELREEIGYRGKLVSLGSYYSSAGFTSEKIHMYLATELVQDPLELDEGEFIQVEEIKWQEALSRALSGGFESHTTLGILLAWRSPLRFGKPIQSEDMYIKKPVSQVWEKVKEAK